MSLKLLKDLDFAAKLNANEAVTESGKEMLKNYRGYCFANAVTCGLVNGFVNECKKYGYDTGLTSILESVENYIKENNISWQLASACESLQNNNSNYSYIAKTACSQVEKLLEMNESEVVSYIKAGVLKGVQYVPEFRQICKNVYSSTINEKHTVQYSITNPISYVVIKEGVQYFNINGKTFQIENGIVSEGSCDDTTFNRVNSHLGAFKQVGESIVYEYKDHTSNPLTFTITEDELKFEKGNISETFNNSDSFREYCDTLSRTMMISERVNFMNISSAIAEVFENMDNVVVLDCANLIATANGTVCAIIESQDNCNVTVFHSHKYGQSSNDYKFMVEAVKDVKKITGVNVNDMYAERINEEAKKQNPEEYKEIQEQLAAYKKEQRNAVANRIQMLAEQYKNDPARITLLNQAAKELALLD